MRRVCRPYWVPKNARRSRTGPVVRRRRKAPPCVRAGQHEYRGGASSARAQAHRGDVADLLRHETARRAARWAAGRAPRWVTDAAVERVVTLTLETSP
jgi:hypothetical protein